MSFGSVSFILWSLLLVVIFGVFVYSTIRSKSVDEITEEVAKEALPEIGRIAEKHHTRRHGSAPEKTQWYPEKKAQARP